MRSLWNGCHMARAVNQIAAEYAAGQNASVDIALGAAPHLVPVLKADFFERVDGSPVCRARSPIRYREDGPSASHSRGAIGEGRKAL